MKRGWWWPGVNCAAPIGLFRTDRIASATEQGERYPGRRSDLLRDWFALMKLDETGRFTPDKKTDTTLF
nr:hypothetical protein GCM10020185_71980 [Pseudomonas brassicacearum subsp. brassicacearum]